jgi:hypothetical protein
MYDRIKEEIDWLLKANFKRPCKYAEWISNIVLVERKGSNKIRVCINFRNLNRATPKDEYHDDGLVPDLLRCRGRSIGGDLNVGKEGSE